MAADVLNLDEEGMRNLLLMMYDKKPSFPIDSDVDIINIFGGPLGSVQVNKDEKISSTKLSKRAMDKSDKFASPRELIDAIVGHSYFDMIMKTDIMVTINKNEYPIESEEEMADILKVAKVAGVDKEDLIKSLDFPIEKPAELIKILREKNADLCGPDVPMLKVPMPEPVMKTAADPAAPAQMPETDKNLINANFGESYIVSADKPDFIFKDISAVLKISGVRFFCISRSNPKHLRNKFELKGDLMWLTENISSSERSIPPSLESLAFTIEEVIRGDRKSIILLDGIEYLISSNQFNPVVKFIRRLVDLVSEADVILIIPISPSAIGLKDLKNLEREMTPVTESDKLNFEEDTFRAIFTEDEIEHAFDMDDDLELDGDLGVEDEDDGRNKKEVVASIAKSMDRIRAITGRLTKDGEGPTGPPASENDTPDQREKRTNIKNQVREWKTEGFQINNLEALLDDPIDMLERATKETQEKIAKARTLIDRMEKIDINTSDPRYTYLRGKLNYPLLLDEAEKEIAELEELMKD